MPPSPGIWFPTRQQLRRVYESIAQNRFDDGRAKRLAAAPSGAGTAAVFKNVGIDGVKGREDIYFSHGHLYVKNTVAGKDAWYDVGPAPLF